MKTLLGAVLFTLVVAVGDVSAASAEYFPPRGGWASKSPTELGFDAHKLKAAVDYAASNDHPSSKDVAEDMRATYGKQEPLFRIIGPTQSRAAVNGVIIRRGFVAAAWGDTTRTDMTNSVTKTFLTTLTGLAWDRGLIRDLHHRVGEYLPTREREELFGSQHNSTITWDHLLRQTSDWSGSLWGIPDWADRPVGATPADHPNRPMHAPGTFYKYNDVRVNLLALCTLHVWREPLPKVLREHIMDPIGASTTWRWHGYETSWIEIDGEKMQSVSGGGHFGGGMFISTWDLARFGYLFLRNGRWGERTIVSDKWIELARTPGQVNQTYGFANWFLNPDRKVLPAAPASSVTFRGNAGNIVYIDWENDLVVVTRWIAGGEVLNTFIGKVLEATTSPTPAG